MKFLIPLIALTFFLTACNSNTAPPKSGPKGVSVMGLQLGTDYDGNKVVIGEGELKDNLAVITFFGLS
ncbi:MAG: hypothetical protein L3J82_07305 [Planctomycetes bacterium]|nr:hypothetical protein [Planctomycetota bacterium]